METRDVRANGARLRLRCWGTDRGLSPLLLLHAAGENSHSWSCFAERCAATRRVYALDFRGHGESEKTSTYSLELLRDDVLGVLDTLALTDVVVIGHSLGGMIGYLIASMRRRELSLLVLEEAPPPLPMIPARNIPQDPGEDFGFDWRVIPDLYEQRNHPDPAWWDDLEHIEIPVLVLAGGSTSHVDQHEMREMADRIPGATLVTIDAGHNIHAAKPDDFLEIVSDFINA
jgi:pimeloyl-ACP methyl ester carboxylesterase